MNITCVSWHHVFVRVDPISNSWAPRYTQSRAFTLKGTRRSSGRTPRALPLLPAAAGSARTVPAVQSPRAPLRRGFGGVRCDEAERRAAPDGLPDSAHLLLLFVAAEDGGRRIVPTLCAFFYSAEARWSQLVSVRHLFCSTGRTPGGLMGSCLSA